MACKGPETKVAVLQKDGQWEELSQTEHTVLLQRIKNAFIEGWCDANTERPEDEVDYHWEHSEAKRVHDTLKELWSSQ